MADQPRADRDRFDTEPQFASAPAERGDLRPDERTLIMEAWALLVKGAASEALDKFHAALSANARSVEALYGVASTLKALGRGDDAIAAYRAALETIGHSESEEDRVRVTMFKHMAESALKDLESGAGKPPHYEPPK